MAERDPTKCWRCGTPLHPGHFCGSDETNPVVGHKTFRDAEGNYSHVPLLKDEADEMWAASERHRSARATLLPDERAAIRAMFDAYDRLRELGWREACYCPKDGTPFDVIEPGSTGIHPCFYSGEWPTGYFMVGEGIDCGPSQPILFRSINKAGEDR